MSVIGHPAAMRNFEPSNGLGYRDDSSVQMQFFVCTPGDQERFPQWGIVTATGRHPPPPRVAGPAEAQLAFTPVAPHFSRGRKKRTGH